MQSESASESTLCRSSSPSQVTIGKSPSEFSKRQGVQLSRESAFAITVSSEIMAILALAADLKDPRYPGAAGFLHSVQDATRHSIINRIVFAVFLHLVLPIGLRAVACQDGCHVRPGTLARFAAGAHDVGSAQPPMMYSIASSVRPWQMPNGGSEGRAGEQVGVALEQRMTECRMSSSHPWRPPMTSSNTLAMPRRTRHAA